MGRIIIMEGLWEMLFGIKVGREKSGHVLKDITWGCDSVERGVWEIMKSNNQIVRWPYKKKGKRSLILQVW